MNTLKLTRAQADHASWALDAMADFAGSEDADYFEADLPKLDGVRLVFPTDSRAVREDMLYRIEEQLPAMADQDSVANPGFRHASSLRSAEALADKIRDSLR